MRNISNPAVVPPFLPPFPRRIRKVGAPIWVLIALWTIAGLLVILLTAVNPVGTAIGFVLSSVAIAVVVLAYLWLDRFEPEPARLLILAFAWGASVAIVVSLILEMLFGTLLGASEETDWRTMAVAAPVIEEAAKGAFLLIMMTGRRRRELNSLVDCLVYAGLVAAGFAWLEDIFYIASGESLGGSLVTAALRLVMAPFAHPLFTTSIGIGVYFALQQRNVFAKIGYLVLGYLGAVLLHGLWNGSAVLGFGWYLAVYVLWMVPMFGLAIWLSVTARRREQTLVAAKLPGMVSAGLVTPNEASWLGSLRNRKLAVNTVTRIDGKAAGKAVRNFATQVVELAFVKDRVDRGFADPRVLAMFDEETQWLRTARAATPALQTLAAYRIPEPLPRR
ncbi:MAG: PrsW family intramembrane metalloprotease [Mycobacterium sp.]